MIFHRSITLVAFLTLMTTACGRKGALIYPDMLVPAAPVDLTAVQSGQALKIKFTLPDKDRAGHSLKMLAGVKISKRINDPEQKDICRNCTTDYQLFRTLYLDILPTDTERNAARLILLDSDVAIGKLYSYRIIPFTNDGVDGAASAVTEAIMLPPLAAPLLKIESLPTEIKLKISIQSLGTGKLLGYNLYRSTANKPLPYQPLNSQPLKGDEYIDASLERGLRYRYSARALILHESGVVIESLNSNEVEGLLSDGEYE